MTSDGLGRLPPRLGSGRFLILETLGIGGTATVYLCWDTREDRWCALKALQKKFLDDEDMIRRFGQEADALAMFDHPNIPALIHHEPVGPPPFMVMELARNGSAMEWVRSNGPMPPTMAADLLFQVCWALAEAHQAGIVHRDVKPHNFLLDENGVCKLTDFGIARWTESTSMTATGSQIGTFSFMAPEQRSDTKSVDERADIYSLGASLYTLLTSRTSAELFVADSDDDLLADVHVEFRKVILEATRYRAEDRYPSARAFRDELMSALSRLPSTDSDFPPLVAQRDPLPDRPPERLPPGTLFPDLEELLEPIPGDSSQPGAPPARDPLTSFGYRMPERPTVRPSRTDHEIGPGYLVSDDGALYSIPTDEITKDIAAKVRAEVALAADDEEGAGLLGIGHAATWILGLALLVSVLMALVVGSGAMTVWWNELSADAAATDLLESMHAEQSVVYDLGGDNQRFEASYSVFQDDRGDGRLLAAVHFVDLLDATLQAGQPVDLGARVKAQRLVRARDAYREAHAAWASAASTFPGSVAVRAGLANPPPPRGR